MLTWLAATCMFGTVPSGRMSVTFRDRLDPLAQQATLGLRAHRVSLAIRDQLVLRVLLERLGRPDLRARLGLLDLKGCRAILVPLDLSVRLARLDRKVFRA